MPLINLITKQYDWSASEPYFAIFFLIVFNDIIYSKILQSRTDYEKNFFHTKKKC